MRYYSLWYYNIHKCNLVPLKKNKHLIDLGCSIREIRKEKGFSQEQLALQANVDRSYIGGIERGERNVSFLTLIKIAECLGCDIAKFTKQIPNVKRR